MPSPPNVYLTSSFNEKNVDGTSSPSMIVSGIQDDFNDFGYRFRVEAHLIGADGSHIVRSMRLMFENKSDTRKFLKEIVPQDALIPSASISIKYCSLFDEHDAYADVVRLFGLEGAIEALRAVNDVVVADADGNKNNESMIDSEAFYLGVLRESGAYKARRRGGHHLRAKNIIDVTDSAMTFNMSALVPPKWNEVDLSFNFDKDEFLRERIAVLIGPNGMGKTSILASIVHGLKPGNDDDWHAERRAKFDIAPASNRVIVVASAPSDTYPESLPPWSGVDYTFVPLLRQNSNRVSTLTMALVDVLRDPDPIFSDRDGLEHIRRRSLLEEILKPLGLWSDVHLPLLDNAPGNLGGKRIAGQYVVPLSAFSGEKKTLITFQNVDYLKPPVHVGIFGLRNLSSGELALFSLAVHLASAMEQASLLLLDEPETHLHPHFISQLMDLLDRILKSTKSCAIIATHSPFIVREVPSRRVQVLVKDGSLTIASKPRLQTFGASIDKIAQDAFADSEIDHLHERLLQHWVEHCAKNKMSMAEILDRYGQDLSPETLSYIRRSLASLKVK